MMSWNHHMSAGGWIFTILAMVVILALVVAAFVWTTRGLRSRQDSGAARASSALEILDRRLASGEIKTDQYVELRRTLVARPEADPSRD